MVLVQGTQVVQVLSLLISFAGLADRCLALEPNSAGSSCTAMRPIPTLAIVSPSCKSMLLFMLGYGSLPKALFVDPICRKLRPKN